MKCPVCASELSSHWLSITFSADQLSNWQKNALRCGNCLFETSMTIPVNALDLSPLAQMVGSLVEHYKP